jgi:hypothetical protein
VAGRPTGRRAGSSPGRAFAPLQPSNFELHTHHYVDELSTDPKKQKTYGRFLGTIFFRGFRRALVAVRQRLADDKNTKK